MTVALVTDDLLAASRVEGAAQRAGVVLKTYSDAASVVARCRDQRVDWLIVDLAARSGDAAMIIEQFNSAGADRPTIIAFGPHVHEKLLAAAADAGCEQVTSRGQFFAQLDAMFSRFADPAARPVRSDQDAAPGG